MKNKISMIALAMVMGFALIIVGCGGGGSSSGGTTSTPPPTTGGGGTTISGARQDGSAAATSATTATVSANMGQTLSTLASPGAPKFKSALAGKDPMFTKFNQALATAMKVPMNRVAEIRKAQSFGAAALLSIIDCSTGTPTTTATDNIMSVSMDTTTLSYSITFTNCKQDTTRLNGTVTLTSSSSGQTTSFTTTIGSGNKTIETTGDFKTEFFENTTATVAYATLTTDISETGTENNTATPPSYSFAADGKMKYDEGANSYAISLTNVNFAFSKNATTGMMTTTSNGTFGESWMENSVSKSTSITFENLVTTETPAPDYTYILYTVGGKVTVANTGFCTDGGGTWIIVTDTPLREMTATGEIVAGKMTINTTTVVEFQSNGSVIVTVNGTPTTVTDAEFDAIESSCAIGDLNIKGPSVTATAAGFTPTVALKSNGTVWSWGWNSSGQFGDGTTTQRTSPVQVTEL